MIKYLCRMVDFTGQSLKITMTLSREIGPSVIREIFDDMAVRLGAVVDTLWQVS